jgi:photosystem II stability/assembly factor-like uncharacterized protein
MKKLSVLLVVLCMSAGALAQWFPQHSGNLRELNSVYFTDSVTGYVVGDYGIILKTINAGVNWTEVYQGTLDQMLNSVYFTDAYTGYVVGGYVEITQDPVPQWIPHQAILKTTNGGTTWTTLSSNTNYPLYSVYFTDAFTGFAVGEDISGNGYGVLFKTINGGATWTCQSIPVNPGVSLTSVHFPDANHGYAVNGGWYPDGNILKTIDGGSTWTALPIGLDYYLASVYFTDVNKGYVVGGKSLATDDGIILKTINGGTTWTIVYQGTGGQFLYSVYFPGADTGYAVGQAGIILRTIDGGSTWSVLTSGTTNELFSVFFTDPNTGYVVGKGGTILKTTNGGGYPEGYNDLSLESGNLKIFPNPTSTAITIETPSKGLLSILNLNGQELLQQEITQPVTTIDVSTLPSGIYVVKVVGEKGVRVEKFIKQ